MKPLSESQTVPSVSPIDYDRSLCRSHWLTLVMTALLSLAVSLQASLVNPDLTTTEGRTEALADGMVINLGPTGLIGWLGHNADDTSESRQILITSVYASSPASGELEVDDVILGVSGDGSTPVDFTSDARMAFALAIGEAEASGTPKLKVKRWRSGSTSNKTLTLQNLGAYTETAPWNCPKSTAILEAAVAHTLANEDAGRYSSNALALMAVKDVSLAGSSDSERMTKAATWAKEAILSNEDITKLMNNEVEDGSGGQVSWPYGHKLIVLSEYYAQTNDNSVVDSIEALAVGIANGMSIWGTVGHRLTQPDKVDGSLNGIHQMGYGTVNSAGLPCFLGLTLAQESGALSGMTQNKKDRVNAGIAAAAHTFAGYANVGGAIPYGEHAVTMTSFDNNGKNSIAALAMSRVAGYEDQSKTFAYMATSAAREFGKGHTGSWFAKVWMPLAANSVGDAAAQTNFNDIKWRLDLARRHDGGFAFNDIYQGNKAAGPHWRAFWANTHAILTYAMPYGKLSLTDNTNNSANHLTGGEVSSAAFASSYDATTRSSAELVTDLDHDIVQIGYAAAEEMGTRSADHAYLVTELQAKVPNAAEPENGRMMACYALGKIGGSDANTSAALVAAQLENSSLRIRYGAAFGLRYFSDSAKQTVITEILNAVVNTAKPVFPKDAEDPMQLAHGQLCYLTVYNGSASGPTGFIKEDKIYTRNLDPALYLPALQAAGRTAMGHARSGLGKIYPELTQEDFDYLCPDMIETIENQPPLDRMFGAEAREGGLKALQERNIADGVGLAKFVHWDLNMPGSESNRFDGVIDVLEDYAGSSELVEPDQGIVAYCQYIVNNSGADNEVINAQSVLDLIAADSNPTPLTSLKSLSVTADDSTLASPVTWTTLHSGGIDLAQGNSVYSWSKVSGPGDVYFTPNGNASATDTVVYTDGTPGTYTFEVRMSDTRGYAETANHASFANGYSEVTETINITVSGSTTPANTVPNVVSMLQASAQSIVVAEGFTLGSISSEFSSTIPAGKVVRQNPCGSSIQTPGTSVNLVISQGVEIVTIASWDVWTAFDADFTSTGITATISEINAILRDVNSNTGSTDGTYGSTLAGADTGAGRMRFEKGSAGNGDFAIDITNSTGAALQLDKLLFDFDVASNTNDAYSIIFENVTQGTATGVLGSATGLAAAWHNVDIDASSITLADGDSGRFVVSLSGAPSSSTSAGKMDNVAITGSLEDTSVVYSHEDFECGTVGESTATMNGTDYTNTANNLEKVGISDHRPSIGDDSNDPTGLHVKANGNANKHFTLTNPMTLVTDNVTSIDLNFAIYFDGITSAYEGALYYSASGNFDDTTTVAVFDPTTAPYNTVKQWFVNQTVSFGPGDVTGGFTDTAKIRLGKGPGSSGQGVRIYFDDIVIKGSLVFDTTPPTLASSDIADDQSGGPVSRNTLVTYTVTFDEDIDETTVDASDFSNAGTSAVTIGSVTETSPKVFTVQATPTTTGTLQLQVSAGAVLTDAAGNALDTVSAIADDTTISVNLMVTVPDVLGLAQATAESDVTTATLTVGNVTTEYSPNVPVGDVISQGLSAGASVAEGSAVDLVVSLGIDPSPKLVRTTVNSVSNSSWTTVNLGQTYNSAVIIATPIYSTADTTALVTRITNVTSTGFDLKVDRADGLTTPITIDVSVVAVDEGVYTQAVDGVTMEAVKFTSTVTAGKDNWVADARTYQNSYTNPVVVGQVMSINDADWSVFWSMGSSRTNPADASNLNLGKHIGEDTNTTRADETIGYIVIEEGSGSISGVAYEAALGGDTVRGFDDSSSPYTYTLSGSLSSASSAAASISGMDGNNGAWAVLSGNPALTTTSIGLHACEDQIVDSEQGHAHTQVGYIVFE